MKNLDKKSNNDLQTLEKELRDKFEEVRFEVVKVYDYWESIREDHKKVTLELRKRGLL